MFWIFFPLLAWIVWLFGPDWLVLFPAASAPLFTGLPFWPLVAVISLRQFQSANVQRHTPSRFALSIPFRWQTFAYPLPGLRHYLRELGRQYGAEVALEAIQNVQFRSLQMYAARRAALDLAADPDTALPFCGQIAVSTNAATLASLGLAGPAARAMVVLAKKEYESWQPLQLFVTFRSSKEIEDTRREHLHVRLAYARKEIDACPPAADLEEFRSLLAAFDRLVQIKQLEGFRGSSRTLEQETAPVANWLCGGWQVLTRMGPFLEEMESYRQLTSPGARREFLNQKIEDLRKLAWNDLPAYWGNLGAELVEYWIDLLTKEAREAREWLTLDIGPPADDLRIGQQTLQIQVRNSSTVLARNVWLRIVDAPGLDWHHREARQAFIEGGQTALMRLELEAAQEGSYRITGELNAEDLAGNPFFLPFAFQINIARAGRPYQLQKVQPYVTGEGVGDDRAFVGRTALLHWLRGLWLQSQGKPAVALVGQRRIGKTSLLNKIVRAGLPDTGLVPVLVDVQGVSGEYDFLSDAARRIGRALETPEPALDRGEPYADFKAFLMASAPRLDGRRILLMLDEADLIPARRLGDQLPGFLRSLMQQPDYPTLLLFCGTHALKRMGREYDSILFNTAQFRTVSYMTGAESAEVLEKPARGVLEFDPLALEDAYRLTRGQPLLLQSLGAILINRFDAVILNGGMRSDYVTLSDLTQAADDLVKQGNAAFESHWQDADPATHRLLAALAWATPENVRPQLDLPGIEAALQETRLELPPGAAFAIVERLAEEEILVRDGPTYRYAVPLYRRWVVWRWPPERVRGERLA